MCYTFSHFELELLEFFGAFVLYYFRTYSLICIIKVCTSCSCSSGIFSAKIFSDLFNIYIMKTTSYVVHLEYTFL